MNKIYTKIGDKGSTGTFKGRISKSDDLAVALGTVDELNSSVGVVRGFLIHDLRFSNIDKELHTIQDNLLNIGSSLAGSEIKISAAETKKLEKLIDKLTAELPKLANFIFPTGPTPVGQLHVTRTIARRAERAVVAAEITDKNILSYLNRLSDVLFTMARWVNLKLHRVDEVWKK
jgi:cob(I)alamin adenosyltransferase